MKSDNVESLVERGEKSAEPRQIAIATDEIPSENRNLLRDFPGFLR